MLVIELILRFLLNRPLIGILLQGFLTGISAQLGSARLTNEESWEVVRDSSGRIVGIVIHRAVESGVPAQTHTRETSVEYPRVIELE
ncbi:MAG: hypothetical protein QXE50_05980 [Nitrososphaerota archaeon]